MRFVHISDLHLGMRLNNYSFIEDQKYMLDEIVRITVEQKCQAVVIAGDIYDKQVPPEEAVALFDGFLSELCKRGIKVLAVSGNHDSAERLSFASGLLSNSGLYIAGPYKRGRKPVVLEDSYGSVNFYLLPFVKPIHIRTAFGNDRINDYDTAVRAAVEDMNIDRSERNVLVAHQYVTGAARSDSELVTVGGVDNVDATAFSDFDYTALGHLHTAQTVAARENIRYCGTMLKYSFSETADKSLCVVELNEKGSCTVNTVKLKPLHDLYKLKGSFETLCSKEFIASHDTEGYVDITLTDGDIIIDAHTKLRCVYKRLVFLHNTGLDGKDSISEDAERISAERRDSPLEVFSELYEAQNNVSLTDSQKEYLTALIDDLWGDCN